MNKYEDQLTIFMKQVQGDREQSCHYESERSEDVVIPCKFCKVLRGGKYNSFSLMESGQIVNLSAPIGEVARSAVGEISRKDKKFEFCHLMKSYVLGRCAQPTLCHSEHLLCHPELVSGSKKQMLNQVQHDRGKYSASPEGDTSSSKRGTSFARLRAGSDSESQARWGASRKGKAAFTLAETLITIGIIGVVAAMTIPNLIQENQKRATVTKLKKAIAVINQAYKLSYEDLGEPENLISMNAGEYTNKYWRPYIKNVGTCNYESGMHFQTINGTEAPYGVISDNTILTLGGYAYIFSTLLYHGYDRVSSDVIVVDTNCDKQPNKYGRDVFVLKKLEDGKGVVPLGYDEDISNVMLKCSKNSNFVSVFDQYCAERIRRAGWRIEKDYPW
ncbi:type II secretion system protein [bacterium]|nr:type II secretion system protein [bacterium]